MSAISREAMVPEILVAVEIEDTDSGISAVCERAAAHALAAACPVSHPELSILVCDDETVRALNRQYRGMDKPTNVLSFPLQDDLPDAGMSMPADGELMLGDIAIAFPTVEREAAAQAKSVHDHLYHLVVHGVLHLLGYDHEIESEAEIMEALETRILAAADIADPYDGSPL